MVKIRDPYFDVIKALAIFMVVLGHVMAFAPHGTFPQWITNFRIGMNMPIFFIISGYFAWPTIESQDWHKLIRHIRSYFQPAIFVGVLSTGLGLCIGLVDCSVSAIIIRLVRSVFVDPWFITTLTECYVLLFLANTVGHARYGTMLIMLAVMICPLFLPGTIHWGCIASMFPHFVFGAIVLRKLGLRIWGDPKWGLVCFLGFIALVLLEDDVEKNGMSFYTADSTILAFKGLKSGLCLFWRPVVGIVGSLGVMAVVRIVIGHISPLIVAAVAKIGTMTLGIYLFHLWPLARMKGISWIGSSSISVVITTIAVVCSCSFITWFLTEKTGRFKLWIWGK